MYVHLRLIPYIWGQFRTFEAEFCLWANQRAVYFEADLYIWGRILKFYWKSNFWQQ